ncbi:hypothetical protein TKK_0011071 [Trichogramma kaykai]|uniref:aralkylamine N-acetyltransferase n=1 Tax=Trichogramma kaykai TaxID=54128 RepID=A0ABD2WUZ0_9HYME
MSEGAMSSSSSSPPPQPTLTASNSVNNVNGEVDCGDGLRCLPVPKRRYDEVMAHLRLNFFADEPLNRAVGLCKKGENHLELERHCLATLASRMSCMIVDENDKIAGTALNGIVKRGERDENERRLAELRDPKFKSIFALLFKINEKCDIPNKYGVDEIFECRILSVDESFRGRGLANLLVENSIRIAKSNGFKIMKADATGLFSQKVFLKYDFNVITEIPYSDVEPSLRPGPPHKALKLMVKILN